MLANRRAQHFRLKPRQMQASGARQQKGLQPPAGLSHAHNTDHHLLCSANTAGCPHSPIYFQEKKKKKKKSQLT